MAVKFIEPGGDADFGTGLWDGPLTGQTADTAVSDIVHGYHLRSLKGATGAANSLGKHTVCQDAGARFSFYFYLNALPTATASFFDVLQGSFGSGILVFRVTTAGVLQLFSSGVQLGSNGSTLPLKRWFRFSVAYTITSTTVYTAKAWIDGASALNVSNTGTLAGTTTADIAMGNISGDTTLDIRWGDLYIDDSNSLTDTSDIWVTAKRPYVNGTNNQFTTQIGSGGSGYGSGHSPQVNERANSDTNGWSISTTTLQTEEYNIEPMSTGDVDITSGTVVDYMGWIRAAESTTSNSPVSHIIVNGVSTAKTLAVATAFYMQVAGSAVYPANTGADIGMDGQYTSVAGTYSLYECGIVVAYIRHDPEIVPLKIANKFVGPMAMRQNFRQPYYPPPVTVVSTIPLDWIQPVNQPMDNYYKDSVVDY